MKKLTTAVLGLGLLIGSTVSANDALDAFYPAVNSDTPDYLESKVSFNNPTHKLAEVNIHTGAIKAFYPAVDNDTPDYLREDKVNQSHTSNVIHQPEISKDTLKAFYPAVNSDTPDYLI